MSAPGSRLRSDVPVRVMLTFPLVADTSPCPGNVGFVPEADSCIAANCRAIQPPRRRMPATPAARASSNSRVVLGMMMELRLT